MNKAAGLKMRRRLKRERRRAEDAAYANGPSARPSHSFMLDFLDVKPWAKQLEVLQVVDAMEATLPAGYQGSAHASMNVLLSQHMNQRPIHVGIDFTADAAFDNDPEDDELQRIEAMLRDAAYRRHHQI